MNFNKKINKLIVALILEIFCISMLYFYESNIDTADLTSQGSIPPINLLIGLCTLLAWFSFWNLIFRFEKTPNLYKITFKNEKKTSARQTIITIVIVISFFLFALLFTLSRNAQIYFNDALLTSFFSCISRCTFCGMLSVFPSKRYHFGTGKVYQYTEEYMKYLYSDSETNIESIILYFVSVYLDSHKIIKLPDSDVALTSLGIIYDAIYPEIETYKSEYEGQLSEVGQALRVFLFDVIKRQLSHNYISSEEYALHINELSKL